MLKNVELDECTLKYRVPQAKFTERSCVTTEPKEPELIRSLESMRLTVKVCMFFHKSYCNEIRDIEALLG